LPAIVDSPGTLPTGVGWSKLEEIEAGKKNFLRKIILRRQGEKRIRQKKGIGFHFVLHRDVVGIGRARDLTGAGRGEKRPTSTRIC